MNGDATQTSDESGTASNGRQGPGGDVQYLLMTVKAIRGREGVTKTKWQEQGWEFVNLTQGTLRSELNFRKVKPKGLGAYMAQGYAAFRRLNPKTQGGLLVGLGALTLMCIGGIVVGTLSGGDTPRPAAVPITASTTAPVEPSAAPTTAPAETTVTDITVDELVDKVNSANMGGMKVGDQFRVTGELVGSDLWTTGASGDFFVTLNTKAGADLIVFVDESAAAEWQDGTAVEMVVQNVEVTINDETSDGWFRAKSVKTISGGTTKESKEAQASQKLSDSFSAYAKTLNKSAGVKVIDSIEPGSTHKVFHINLNMSFASLSILEAQATIKKMNGQLVDIASDNDSGTPILTYYLAGEVVAQNRYIVDPWDVAFKGMLET